MTDNLVLVWPWLRHMVLDASKTDLHLAHSASVLGAVSSDRHPIGDVLTALIPNHHKASYLVYISPSA